MPDSYTAKLNLTKPEVGASTDTWGTKVNGDLDSIDALFETGPYLKIANGGTAAGTAAGARTSLGVPGISTTNTFTSNQIISVTDNTNAALRVTQLGTGNAILVEDSTNPDATPFVIANNGRTTIGYTASVAPVSGLGAGLGVHGDGTLSNSLSVFRWSSDSFGSFITASKSRGSAAGTQGIVSSGDTIGTMLFTASDGVDFQQAARIDAVVDGTPGTNDMPGRLVFSTTADGASSATERFRIGSAGQFGIAGANYGTSGQVLVSAGSSAAVSWADKVTRATSIATTSGTAHDFSSIPSGVKRITLMISGVSTNGTGNVILQLGSSGTPLASGYLGTYAEWQNGGNAGLSNHSTSFTITGTSGSSTTRHGTITLTNLSGNIWTMTSTVTRSDSAFFYSSSGSVTLSGTLDILRLSSTSTFDAGNINIIYE